MKSSIKALSLLMAFAMVSGCGNESTKLIPKAKINKEEVSEKPADFAIFNPKVDILFVIDNSASMDDAQSNLSRNAAAFADGISKVSILDYHIGVLTTDMACRYSNKPDACGKLVGTPSFVQNSTPNLVSILSSKMMVGLDGDVSEMMFSPVVAALSPPLDVGVNAGFYRQDAFLAVIFITDAKEQSTLSPKDFQQFLNTKKGDPNKVLAYGVINKLAEEDICPSSESLDGKLEEFLGSVVNGDKAQTNVLSLCAPDFGVKLAEFARDIVRRTAGSVKLSRTPNEKTIVVKYGTQVIPNSVTEGWVYEPATRSILLAEGIKWDYQGPGVGLTIDFEAIDIE
ncbi:hypothetical protein [Bdellovibrio bacteriovorus]|uniref:VWFA domain-containing protein n=1 Tax=Bdellovibrio bacteriovorus TaxID=959 RepID=A0A1Z3N7H6_BDEBC|nr:hypothetical protein [Bdellovibrio bacteriovorus]ASD63406.1 hypothetical protein B9G79_07375 [Bdellovibrio bacteriovorus]